MSVFLEVIPCLSDNYAYLVRKENSAVLIDAPEAAPIIKVLQNKGLNLDALILTHHHYDHIAGVNELKSYSLCEVIAPCDERIDFADTRVVEGEIFKVGSFQITPIEVPGHTSSHFAFYFEREGILFTGDSLFCGGCGRLFEGTAEQMLESINKLLQLPDSTLLYCGHEYTLQNLTFALSLEPANESVKARIKDVKDKSLKGIPSVPSTIGEEKQTNPFCKVGLQSFKDTLGMSDLSDVELFAQIRAMKDRA